MAGHPLFRVDIVTPEATIWTGEAEFISARTTEGDIGIYAGHEPTMAALATGPVAIHTEDVVVSAGVHGGFLQIFEETVTLLTDRAEITEGSHEEALRVARELAAVEETLADL
ncbi:MAG: ATP synthase F1 subunit epsilon [Acidimicrobiia bacterium]|nr:ATP synthase F1 subunit epsilon [Acidimicrobiia bacterium]